MKKLYSLLKELPNKDIFTLKDAYKAGISRYYLSKLIDAELILQVKKGVFQNHRLRSTEEDAQEVSFRATTAKLKERSIICLWSALSYYDITEQIPSNIWLWVPYPYGATFVKTIRVKNLDFSIGVEEHDGFSVTSIERTLIECFLHPKYVAVSESFAALKESLKDKKTSMKKILAVAKQMRVEERIYPFIEIALSQL